MKIFRTTSYGLILFALLMSMSGISSALAAPDLQGTVKINEIRIDQPSTDLDEYFELAGPAGTSLDGLTYLVIGDGSGGSGVIEAVVDLTGYAIPSSGYFVAAESTFTLGTADLTTSLNFENSDNVTHLLVSGFTGSNGEDLDTNDDGTLDSEPWTTVLDSVALIASVGSGDLVYSATTVGPDGSYVPGQVYRCGAVWEIGDFDPASGTDTPGEANPCAYTQDVLINEIRIDQPSTDLDEYFELAGPAGTSLDGLTYLVIGDGTGGSGVIEAVVDLTGYAIPSSGYFVAAESTFTLETADLTTSLNFENSDNVTHLLVSGFTGSNGEDLDTNDDGTLDSEPWTTVLDSVALIASVGSGDLVYSATTVGPDGSFVPGQVYRCGAVWEIGDFDPAGGTDTPGEANLCTYTPDVLINEIRIDQTGADDDEYFELTGPAGTSLEGLTYVVIGDSSSGSGVIEAVVDLTGSVIPSSGYFVAAESTFTLGTADLTTSLNFENSDNVTHLLVSGFTGSNGEDLDTDDDGVLDVEPWAAVLDSVALIETVGSGDLVYSATTVGPDGSYVPGHVYRCEDGWRIGPFGGGGDTPGAANPCAFGFCGAPATLIHDIQGDGFESMLVGSVQVVEAIVVGDFDGPNQLSGVFVQEEAADMDANPLTSEGIFIYRGSFGSDLSVGDVVRVQGSVAEYSGLTELNNLQELVVCSSGPVTEPADFNLPANAPISFEAVEGMLVSIDQELTVTGNYTLGRYGEVDLSVGGRLYTPTNLVDPGPGAILLQAQNDLRRIQLDDGSSVQNPVPVPPYFGPDGTLRAGDTTPGLVGVMSNAFGAYEIQPVEQVEFSRVNDRPYAPPEVGGEITVASFNVLNYFTTLGSRGAGTLDEFKRQRDKIIAAIVDMDADVVGLMEIENHPQDAALIDLVQGLNDVAGTGTYDYIATGPIGTDAIKVALIYQPANVSPYGGYAVLDSSVDSRFVDTKNRPALAQTFADNDGALFTVAVNHLKSKGSDCNDLGDPDTGDGQGNCNLTRLRAAQALADWLASDPTGSQDADAIIIGDLNSYAMEDPIAALEAAGYTNLIAAYGGEHAYSYVFEGQAGYLDHALANPTLALQVTGNAVWHINADEPVALDYNDYNQPSLYHPDPYASSDHDPVLTGLNLSIPPVANAGGPYDVDEGGSVVLDATGSYDPDVGDLLTYAWDFNNDGVYDDAVGVNPTYSAVNLDGPGSMTVGLLVTDLAGNSDTATAEISILNVPPVADAGPDQTVYRNDVVSLNGSWTDPAGNLDQPYAWSWDLTGDGVADISGQATYGDTIPATTSFALEGTYALSFGLVDKDGGAGDDEVMIEVLNQPPVCDAAFPSLDELWPANHKFVSLEVLGITDPEGDDVAITIDSIFQDEEVDDGGDGSNAPDAAIYPDGTFDLRAERSGTGDGRFYHVSFSVDDGHGGSCTGEVLVIVPHDSGKDATPADDGGALYDSTLLPEPEEAVVPESEALPSSTPEAVGKEKKEK